MSHIHVPDGILPFWLWLSGYLVIAIYLIIFLFKFKKDKLNNKLPLVGVLSALMLVTMSLELPIGYHVNLATLSGIILGPWLAVLSIFIVNIILAFLGHGGITVIGLNTIVVSIEAILSFFIFKIIVKKIKKVFISTFLATFIALFFSAWCTIGVVYFGTNNLSYLVDHDHENVHSQQIIDKNNATKPENKNIEFDIKKFILAIMLLGLVGWTLEAFITAFIVNYINKIKPDILENSTNSESNILEIK